MNLSTVSTPFDALLRRAAAIREAFDRLTPALALHTAHEFTPFQFVRCDELGLSQIIRWLFDANGSHGQKGLFLRHYLDKVADRPIFEGVNCDTATAACEVSTTHQDHVGRRIDILVHVGKCCLAIENKPWAVWQENQLAAYFEDIQGRYEDMDCRILALKGWVGSSPRDLTDRISSDKLIDTDYGKFVVILRGTIPYCKAEHIRRFLEAFADHLDHLFGGKSMSLDSNEVARQIIADPDLSTSAFDLIGSRYDLFDELARKIDADLDKRLVESELELIERLSSQGSSVAYPSLALRGRSGSVFRVTFYKGLEGGYWGLKDTDNENLIGDRNRIAADERARANDVKVGAGWIWWKNLIDESDFEKQPDIWRAMANGTLAKLIIEKAEASIECANRT